MSARDRLRDARRIVVKVGTSTLTHPSGGMNLHRIEHLVRELIDEANQGKEGSARLLRCDCGGDEYAWSQGTPRGCAGAAGTGCDRAGGAAAHL